MQTTSHILMIRPVNFSYNEETAVNNAFQVAGNAKDVQQKAEQEFDTFVQLLRNEGVDVMVINDTPEPHTPDSIFPNNWISFHEDGSTYFYPMFAVNRRWERRMEVIQSVEERFFIKRTFNLTENELDGLFLEGTGSMVLDRENKIVYACLSPRTSSVVLYTWARTAGYKAVVFNALDEYGQPIYHTNVMMCVGDYFVVICLECITDSNERMEVIQSITDSGKEIIAITYDQVKHFAGNMLQVENAKGEKLLVMSTQAYVSLTNEQIDELSTYNKILHSPLTTIETNGGGSARCMMAEIHLPLKN